MGAQGDRRTVLMLGNYLPSLAVARALSAAGYHVIAGDSRTWPALAASRHCDEVWVHPPIADREPFLDALVSFLGSRRDVTTVLPVFEDHLALLAEGRRPLPGGVVVAMPEPATVVTCLDKPAMYAVAARAQVPHLPLTMVTDHESLVAACDHVGYPVVIRPTGRQRHPDQGGLAWFCTTREEVAGLHHRWQKPPGDLLVQPYIQASVHNVYFAALSGRLLAWSESERLETDRPDGTGVNVHAVTVAPDPRMTRWTEALLEALDYTGVGLVQFLVSANQGTYFMELNPRIGAAAALAQRVGLDLAVAACELAMPGSTWRPDSRASERVGKRYAWTSGSLRGLVLASRRGELTSAQALRWLARTGLAAVRADAHATWTVRDPGPTVAIFANWLPRRRRDGQAG